MDDLEYPDIELDMQIIARARLRLLKSAGLVSEEEREPEIPHFTCVPRAYLCRGGEYFMMFFPDAVDLETCASSIIDEGEEPIEFWVLEDDRVIDYNEFVELPE